MTQSRPTAADPTRIDPDTPAHVATVLAQMADDIAAMVETEHRRAKTAARVIANALGELHTSLDELGHRLTPTAPTKPGVTVGGPAR